MQSLLYDFYSALFLPRHRYPDDHSAMRARTTLLLAIFTAVGCLILLVALATSDERTTFVNSLLAGALAGLLILLAIIGLVHSGQLRPAMSVLFAFLLAFAFAVLFVAGPGAAAVILLTLPLIYASMVWDWQRVLAVMATEVVILVLYAVLQWQGLLGPLGPAPDWQGPWLGSTLLSAALLIIVGVLTATYSNEYGRVLHSSARIMTQLRATAEIAEIAATANNPNALLQRAVNYIRDRFGFYYVQIFLVDNDKRYASLAAGTGEIGEMLMERGHRLAVGPQSAIGRALLTGEPNAITTGELGMESLPGHRVNELLRDTRSELVLPLVIGDQVIGALDVQSTRLGTFTLDVVENLRILAIQVGVAINQTRQLEDLKVELSDMRRMFLETEINLRETQRLNQRLTGKAWEDYLKARSDQTIGYTLSDNRLQRDSSWTVGLDEAAGKRRPVIRTLEGERLVLSVPVELRGRSIGAIEVEMGGAVRQAETLDVLQSVAQRLALSIDNARLFEQAQELAQRELEVNTISGNLQGINDIDSLARATIHELSRALGAAQAAIRLGTAPGGEDAAAAPQADYAGDASNGRA
jgi:GAF domain-containing protein